MRHHSVCLGIYALLPKLNATALAEQPFNHHHNDAKQPHITER